MFLSHYGNDVVALERMPKKLNKMWPGMESYQERIHRLRLLSLECMRLRGNLTEIYKTIRGIDRIDNHGLFPWVGEC